MVARIKSGTDVKGALNYNEHKVAKGEAELIQASMFLKDPDKLTFYDKLTRFVDLNEKNRRAKTNTLHITLNFSTSERIPRDKLNAIVSTYMERIGFGDQPYLAYEHMDAAHQHVHIVTTIIKEDGKRIPINYIGKHQSEKARKAIEREFYLVPASRQQVEATKPNLAPAKPTYGKSETFRSISDIARYVTRNYKYTSLPELNAVLQQYNVMAYRGTEKSQMFAKKGLLYWMTTDDGQKIGVPIKASRIPGKPTMMFLEKQFRVNEVLRAPHKEALRQTVDRVMSTRIDDRQQFIRALELRNVDAIFRINAEGRVYGLSFIDHRSKSVFKGSDLGKTYSAGAITERFGIVPLRPDGAPPTSRPGNLAIATEPMEDQKTSFTLLEDLFHSNRDYSYSPGNIRRRRKKRRRRRPGL
jgi:hypothetical protein